jgi:hypothetical protein
LLFFLFRLREARSERDFFFASPSARFGSSTSPTREEEEEEREREREFLSHALSKK